MTIAEMKAHAVEQARLYGEHDCNPVISDYVPDIVAQYRRAQIRADETAYAYGDVVQLPERNGHRYRCIEAGTSDDSEPDFSTAIGARVEDGTVVWREEGSDYENVYDVRAIIHACWTLKASKSSHLVTTSQGNARVEASALQAQCRQRAAEYAPLIAV